MKRFIAIMNDGSFINTAADRMTIQENVIYAWDGENLVAVVDISAVISAHVSEKGGKEDGK